MKAKKGYQCTDTSAAALHAPVAQTTAVASGDKVNMMMDVLLMQNLV